MNEDLERIGIELGLLQKAVRDQARRLDDRIDTLDRFNVNALVGVKHDLDKRIDAVEEHDRVKRNGIAILGANRRQQVIDELTSRIDEVISVAAIQGQELRDSLTTRIVDVAVKAKKNLDADALKARQNLDAVRGELLGLLTRQRSEFLSAGGKSPT